jgi:hypothetical protein
MGHPFTAGMADAMGELWDPSEQMTLIAATRGRGKVDGEERVRSILGGRLTQGLPYPGTSVLISLTGLTC